jgi:cellulose synthase/poly-beta-1,6-N-acetylglucosamine synthase-like glycosyltransferase
MIFIFWASALLVAYTYAGYPALIWWAGVLRPRPWRQAQSWPTVSVVLPIHNAEALVAPRIRRLLDLDYPAERVEIIVVSDGSTDGTNQELAKLDHPRLRALTYDERRGKAHALNLGMRAARNEVLMFVDIRPRLEPDCVRLLIENFADSSVGCAAGQLTVARQKAGSGAAAVGSLYWHYEEWLRRCEGLVDSPCGVYGGCYAVRRELARELPEDVILDDMYQPLSVIRQGFRSVLDPRARVADQWPATAAGEFRRKVRTLAGNYQLLQLAPWLLSRENRVRFQLISHKLLRLAVPVFLLLLLLSSGLHWASLFYRACFLAQAGFYALALLGCVWQGNPLRRLTTAIASFTLLNAAAVVGCYRFVTIRGPLWALWTAAPEIPRPAGRE